MLDAGRDPATILSALLPDDGAAALPPVSTTLTLDSDTTTLRPVHLVLELRSDDGAVDVRIVVDASRWDEDLVIEEPPSGS